MVALLEGLSLILLVFVCMPLKYWAQQPQFSSVIGPVHGALFLLYILGIIQNQVELDWPIGKSLLAIVLSFIPFGTFYVTGKMIPQLEQTKNHD